MSLAGSALEGTNLRTRKAYIVDECVGPVSFRWPFLQGLDLGHVNIESLKDEVLDNYRVLQLLHVLRLDSSESKTNWGESLHSLTLISLGLFVSLILSRYLTALINDLVEFI